MPGPRTSQGVRLRRGRTLPVSHRCLLLDAAKRLPTGMFAEQAGEPRLGRAEVALLHDSAHPLMVHPVAWVSFAIVGEDKARP
jgi:hypothetical protein